MTFHNAVKIPSGNRSELYDCLFLRLEIHDLFMNSPYLNLGGFLCQVIKEKVLFMR